ncbi:MAG: DUF4387 family protein [Albidovulum sp.]|nr:DUF4387 family protein [Albidovulum sp.]
MTILSEEVEGIRAKNAGPFMLTIDIFCGSAAAFEAVSGKFPVSRVANMFDMPASEVRLYQLPELNVLKFSFPRAVAQGGALDRDMHGAQFAAVLAECPVDDDGG